MAIAAVGHLQSTVQSIEREVAKVMVGQQEVVRGVVIALLVARGHCLLEGVPGLGKTLLVRVLAEVLDLSFSRIQFTPDLMPADIVGTNIIAEDASGDRFFRFEPGPIFANLVLADEINRATPKTQSALLEAMQEQTVSVAKTIHPLPRPFFVLATQNPMEMEGTYPLPEAQLDRFFFKLQVNYPSAEELSEILIRTTGNIVPRVRKVVDGPGLIETGEMAREVPIPPAVLDYAGRLVLATHPGRDGVPKITNNYIRYGSSPRGAQSLILAAKIRALLEGRSHVMHEDIQSVCYPALRHRLILNLQAEMEGITADNILDEILRRVPE
ncbi:MAG: MoxR family ATPase [Chloroflexi bacterium]|nr:MoxR family ATPase [Chloroflexota bacterium]